jgi:AcrR family transcriptional regulator
MLKRPKSRPSASKRTNAEITAETRAKLLAAARKAFVAHGFGAAAGEAIVAKAGVTRGALYYQFGDMHGLFAAVAEAVAQELVRALYEATMASLPRHKDGEHNVDELEVGADLLLRAFATGDAAELLLREAPVVMGHAKWAALIQKSGLRGLIDHALGHWVEARLIPERRREATAQLIFGALAQAGLAIAEAPNRATALATYREATRELIRALAR